jgi:ABC-type bacteriocin/lantibiotic exporter with double-glycine peptidase domain
MKNFNTLNIHYNLFSENKKKKSIILFLLIASVLEMSGIALIYPLVALFFNLNINKGIVYDRLIDILTYYNFYDLKIILIFFLFFLLLLKAFFLIYFRYLLSNNSFNIILKYRKKIFKNLFLSKYGYVQEKLSKITNTLTYQSDAVGSAVTNQFNIIGNFINISFLFLLFIIFSFKIFLISLLLIIVSTFFFRFLISFVKILSGKLLDSQKKYYLVINETLKNYQYLKVSNSYSHLYFNFVKILINIKNNNILFVLVNRGTQFLSEPITVLLILLTFYIAIDYLNFDIALAGVLFIICLRLYGGILKLFDNIQSYKKDLVSYKDLNLFLNNIQNNIENKKRDKILPLFRKIIINNLTFSQKEKIIFKNLSFEIDKNTLVLIKGKSGSGKSTLLNCLTGLIEPTDGQITYDNINIYDINKNDLKNKIGYVLQENFFFHGSIIENLKFNNKNIDLAELDRLAKILNLNNLIKENININEATSNLSIGEKQRLALLRELIKKPQVLILDEVTSSIDQKSINLIISYIKLLKKNVTIVAVTHKDDFDEISDKIIEF